MRKFDTPPTLVVAAATENNDNGKDDNPGAVVVKEIAKAVVIHICSSEDVMAVLCRSLHIMQRPDRVTQGFTHLYPLPQEHHFAEKKNRPHGRFFHFISSVFSLFW